MRQRRHLRPLVLVSALCIAQACSKSPEPPPLGSDKSAPAEPAEKAPAGEDAPADDKAPAEAPAVPATPAAVQDSPAITELGEVVATAQIPTGTAMRDLAAFADMVQPGASLFATSQAPKLLEQGAGMKLGGAKLDGPVSLVVLDPNKHEMPVGMLVAIADGEKLRAAADSAGKGYVERDGYALLGPKDVVEAATEWAFTHLAKTPDHSELIVYPGPLMAAAGPLIEQAMAAANQELTKQGNPGMMALMSVYEQGFRSLVDQTERMVLSVSPGQQSGDINLHMYPKAGCSLEGFIAAQTVSDHALMAKLPAAANPSVVVSGELHSGEAHGALIQFMADASLAMYKTELDGQAWAELMTRWLDTLDGRMALVVDASAMAQGTPKMTMSGLIGAHDGEQMRTVWREFMKAFVEVSSGGETEMMGMGVSAKLEPDIRTHEGVRIDRYATTLDLSKLPPDQRAALEQAGASEQALEFAAFDKLGALSSTEDSNTVTTLIDAARGKGETLTLTPVLNAVFEDAQRHGESLVYFMDIAAMAPAEAQGKVPFAGFCMNIGRLDSALSLRVSLHK